MKCAQCLYEVNARTGRGRKSFAPLYEKVNFFFRQSIPSHFHGLEFPLGLKELFLRESVESATTPKFPSEIHRT